MQWFLKLQTIAHSWRSFCGINNGFLLARAVGESKRRELFNELNREWVFLRRFEVSIRILEIPIHRNPKKTLSWASLRALFLEVNEMLMKNLLSSLFMSSFEEIFIPSGFYKLVARLEKIEKNSSKLNSLLFFRG